MQTLRITNQKSNLVNWAVCSIALTLLTGCFMPCPHTTLRTAEVRGRVLDERTHAPIQGAKISFSQNPKHSCTSDATGRFRMRATHNFHLAYVYTSERFDWPERLHDSFFWVSHPDYEETGDEVYERGFEGDILLRRKK
jgi:hypothetical protein